jgi:hypothetical protein
MGGGTGRGDNRRNGRLGKNGASGLLCHPAGFKDQFLTGDLKCYSLNHTFLSNIFELTLKPQF